MTSRTKKEEVLSSQRLLFRAEITGNDVQEFFLLLLYLFRNRTSFIL
jgi:hypothetical protein